MIFGTEQKELERARDILNDDAHRHNPLLAEFGILLDRYEKMFRQFRSLIRISDNQQKCLNDLNRKLAESNKSKDKFFSIISHDLRAPLGFLINIGELLQEQTGRDGCEEDVCHMAGQICSSAKNLHELLENLLTWSRIQRDAMEFHSERLDVLEVIGFNLELLTPHARKKDIRIRNSVGRETAVISDFNVLSTVLRNLISNAIKFTPRLGSVEISARAHGDGAVAISVSDTGVGISSENLGGLFRIDIRSSETGTEGEKGSGLGLVLCKELLDKSGGDIRVQSRTGRGTVVSIVLPGTLSRKDGRDSSEPEDPLSRMFVPDVCRMLVADGIPLDRRLLANMMDGLGFLCREAASAHDVLDIWREWRPHFVWMDVRMPDRDGFDPVKAIRSEEGGADTVLVALVSAISRTEREAVASQGYDALLSRPFEKSEIMGIFRKHGRECPQDRSCGKRDIRLSSQSVACLPGIKEKLEKEIIPRWKEISEFFFISDISDFAEEISRFALAHGLDFLGDYSRSLYDCAEKSNIDEIEKLMALFPKIADGIMGIEENSDAEEGSGFPDEEG